MTDVMKNENKPINCIALSVVFNMSVPFLLLAYWILMCLLFILYIMFL